MGSNSNKVAIIRAKSANNRTKCPRRARPFDECLEAARPLFEAAKTFTDELTAWIDRAAFMDKTTNPKKQDNDTDTERQRQ